MGAKGDEELRLNKEKPKELESSYVYLPVIEK